MTYHWYCSRTGCVGMGMCCDKMTTGWRNVFNCMEYEVEGPRPRGRPKRTWREVVWENCQARKMNKEDAINHWKWRKMIKDVRWWGWVWVGECFFWYRPTRVVPDQRPLNGCVCVCVCTYSNVTACQKPLLLIPDSFFAKQVNIENKGDWLVGFHIENCW